MTNVIQYGVLAAGIVFILLLVLIVEGLEMNMTEIACDVFGNSGMSMCD
ncbi:hypothetical protein [Halorubrum salipaludis]|nr:hypothetical protein [Halorubrum salipaludis]